MNYILTGNSTYTTGSKDNEKYFIFTIPIGQYSLTDNVFSASDILRTFVLNRGDEVKLYYNTNYPVGTPYTSSLVFDTHSIKIHEGTISADGYDTITFPSCSMPIGHVHIPMEKILYPSITLTYDGETTTYSNQTYYELINDYVANKKVYSHYPANNYTNFNQLANMSADNSNMLALSTSSSFNDPVVNSFIKTDGLNVTIDNIWDVYVNGSPAIDTNVVFSTQVSFADPKNTDDYEFIQITDNDNGQGTIVCTCSGSGAGAAIYISKRNIAAKTKIADITTSEIYTIVFDNDERKMYILSNNLAVVEYNLITQYSQLSIRASVLGKPVEDSTTNIYNLRTSIGFTVEELKNLGNS